MKKHEDTNKEMFIKKSKKKKPREPKRNKLIKIALSTHLIISHSKLVTAQQFFPEESLAQCPRDDPNGQLFDGNKEICYECNGNYKVAGEFSGLTCCPLMGSLVELNSMNSPEECAILSCDLLPITNEDTDPQSGQSWQQITNGGGFCNSIKDCRYGDDELGCGSCDTDQFRCKNPNSETGFSCLDESQICDGIKDPPI